MAGMDSIVLGMSIGDVRTTVLPPELAFGKSGVYYFRNYPDTIYVINPNDSLTLQLALINFY
jgi:FKBP-type peptidyl-prolyl cis-trans isomerase